MNKNRVHFFRAKKEFPKMVMGINNHFINRCSTFVEFQKSPFLQKLISKDGLSEPNKAVMINMLYFMTKFVEGGHKIYNIRGDLCRELCYTKLDLDSSVLESYDGGIYLAVPPDLFYITEGEEIRRVHGMYVIVEKFGPGEFSEVYREYVPGELEMLGKNIEDVNMQIRVMSCGFPELDDGTLVDDYFMYFRMPVFPGLLQPQLDDYLDWHIKDMHRHTTFQNGDEKNIWRIPGIFNLVVNILLTLQSSDTLIEKEYTGNLLSKLRSTDRSGKRAKNLRKKFSTEHPYFDVGSDIRLSNEEREMFSVRKNWTISYEFIVSGHYRNQWYPSEGRHKRIRIRPFIKGAGKGPKLST